MSLTEELENLVPSTDLDTIEVAEKSGQINLSSALNFETIDQFPSIVSVSKQPDDYIRIELTEKLAPCQTVDYPHKMFELVSRLFDKFAVQVVAPKEVVTDLIHSSIRYGPSFANRPYTYIPQMSSVDLAAMVTHLSKNERVEITKQRDMFDMVRLTRTKVKVDMFWIDRTLNLLCNNVHLKKFGVSRFVLEQYLSSIKFHDRFVKPDPELQNENIVLKLDKYFDFYEYLVSNTDFKFYMYQRKKIEVSRSLYFDSNKLDNVISNLYSSLSINQNTYSTKNEIPQLLTSGSARVALENVFTVLKLNAVFQLEAEIPNIMNVTTGTFINIMSIWVLYPYSVFSPRTWRVFANYCWNFLKLFLYPNDVAKPFVDNYHKNDKSYLLTYLNPATDAAFINFFSRVGSGAFFKPNDVYDGGSDKPVSSREMLLNQNNATMDQHLTSLHAGKYIYVTFSTSKVQVQLDDDVEISGDPIMWHYQKEMFIKLISKTNRVPQNVRYVGSVLEYMLRQDQNMIELISNMNEAVRVLGFSPLDFGCSDIDDTKRSYIPVDIKDFASVNFLVDGSSLKAKVENFDYITNDLGLLQKINNIGREVYTYVKMHEFSRKGLETDITLDGKPVRTSKIVDQLYEKSKLINKALSSFSGIEAEIIKAADPLMKSSVWMQFPEEHTFINIYKVLNELVVTYRQLFGFDTGFMIQSDEDLAYGSVGDRISAGKSEVLDVKDEILVERKFMRSYWVSNVIQKEVDTKKVYVEDWERGSDKVIGRTPIYDMMNTGKLQYDLVRPGACHARLVFLSNKSQVSMDNIIDSLVQRKPIVLGVRAEFDTISTIQGRYNSITMPDLFYVFRFPFYDLRKDVELDQPGKNMNQAIRTPYEAELESKRPDYKLPAIVFF